MSDDQRPVERTTIIETRGGGGSSGVAIVLLVLIALVIGAYLFRDQLGFGTKATTVNIPDKIDVNVT